MIRRAAVLVAAFVLVIVEFDLLVLFLLRIVGGCRHGLRIAGELLQLGLVRLGMCRIVR